MTPSDPGPKFSFVIPTMQRSSLLWPLLASLDANPLVGEVLVINNSAEPLDPPQAKVRVVHSGWNLFVNPSWNLGVSLSRYPLVALCNDDIAFPSTLLGSVASALDWPVGLVGPSNVCFKDIWSGRTQPGFRVAYERPAGYGTLLFMRRERYLRIPEEIRIWFGDDWLFASQRRRNLAFHGVHIRTPMSVTSASPEFAGIYASDLAAFQRCAPSIRRGRVLEARVYRWASRALAGARRSGGT